MGDERGEHQPQEETSGRKCSEEPEEREERDPIVEEPRQKPKEDRRMVREKETLSDTRKKSRGDESLERREEPCNRTTRRTGEIRGARSHEETEKMGEETQWKSRAVKRRPKQNGRGKIH